MMKHITPIAVSLVLAGALAVAGTPAQAVDGIVLRINGMTCEGCVMTVEGALRSLEGVRDVGVELASGLGWVLFDEPGALRADELIKAVEGAGFSATAVEGAILAVIEEGGTRRIITQAPPDVASPDALARGAACVRPPTPELIPALGLVTATPSRAQARDMGLAIRVRTEGRVVSSVEPGGPADLAGLRPGDVVLQLDDNRLYSEDDVKDFVRIATPGEPVDLLVKRAGSTSEETLQLTPAATPRAPGAGSIDWQYAGLGQLERALEDASAHGKRVMVGVSGSDTCCAFSRFEVESLARILGDAAVVEGSEPFVRIIVRRPHAYWFLEALAGIDRENDPVLATPDGLRVGGRAPLPIPGVYFLDHDGTLQGQVGLSRDNARGQLLSLLEQLGSP